MNVKGLNGMIHTKRYSETCKELWNEFNSKSKNAMFMFNRNYMDYHRDRFIDHSLLLYSDDELIALFPACEKEGYLFSHAGLTFGGFIINEKMKQHTMNDCFDALINYAASQEINEIIYKTIPHIYHIQPAEEDRYSLYANGAKLITVDASTVINLSDPLKMPKGRKAQISKARREGVEIKILTAKADYEAFINLENQVLEERHNTRAVHTAAELKLLHDRFPDNINLYGAIKDGILIAGTVVYDYSQVIHTQYMAANEEARTVGALDFTIATVIEQYKTKKLWMDFGISTEHGRIYLNEGLISQKEGFGGRTNTYEIWKIGVKNKQNAKS